MRYVLHPDVTARAGRIGDTVTMMRGGRAISRRYVHPANPNTAAQVVSRSTFVQASDVWASCTSDQRYGWDYIADTYYADKVDTLGNPAPWSGQTLCTATNIHRILSSYGTSATAYTGSVCTTPLAPDSAIIEQSTNRFYVYFVGYQQNDSYVRFHIYGPLSALDYAVNPVLFRSPFLPDEKVNAYDFVHVSNQGVWQLGADRHYCTDFVEHLRDGALIAIQLLWLGDTFMPCPTGPLSITCELTVS